MRCRSLATRCNGVTLDFDDDNGKPFADDGIDDGGDDEGDDGGDNGGSEYQYDLDSVACSSINSYKPTASDSSTLSNTPTNVIELLQLHETRGNMVTKIKTAIISMQRKTQKTHTTNNLFATMK